MTNGRPKARLNIPGYIVICAGRDDLHLLHLHNVFQLSTHLTRLAKKLGMQEMFDSPIIAKPGSKRQSYCKQLMKAYFDPIPMILPLLEDVQKR